MNTNDIKLLTNLYGGCGKRFVKVFTKTAGEMVNPHGLFPNGKIDPAPFILVDAESFDAFDKHYAALQFVRANFDKTASETQAASNEEIAAAVICKP